ncbi:MAG TPA: 16S rRNA (cytosine(1402)-N(4))-methyltransferase RsmH [Rhodanobacteraceae bacterium]|nr:16S rRNA (cytosine(1402)-N(4))-methyltransferase RsmH [Rhodanobacteraceae bacterium]
MARDKLEHIPVMRAEAVAALAVRADGRYLDATFGRGGHAASILAALGPAGRLLLLDRDPEAIRVAQARYADEPRVAIRHASFADLDQWDETATLDGALFDFGVSSPQLDDPARGFSFMADAPLDMRMDPSSGESVSDYLAHADEREIADVLWRYGEERMSRRIAHAIVVRRTEAPLTRTGELAALIERAIGRREPGKHPATRSFQALRIKVNGELEAIEAGLAAVLPRLQTGARLAAISFHSLEDRLVKRFIRDHAGIEVGDRRRPPLPGARPAAVLRAVGKAIFPSEEELKANPRARSAVLRVAEKLP